jgi:hypothetical protein
MTTTESIKAGPADARELTERIREAAETVRELVLEAHDRNAWEALGYDSWQDYVGVELHLEPPETVSATA